MTAGKRVPRLGPALGALGFVAVAVAVWRGGVWALVAAGAAALWALALGRGARRKLRRPAPGSSPRPFEFSHVIDLVRRVHGGRAAWAVGLADADLEVFDPGSVAPTVVRDRGAALVRLASVDGRAHVEREDEGTFVAVGDFPYGAGVLLEARDASPARAEAVAEELRRLIATMRLSEVEAPEAVGQVMARRLALGAAGQTLEAVARVGAELAQQVAQRGAAVAVQQSGGQALPVLAVSPVADRRLAGRTLAPESPVGRAVQSGIPVVTVGNEDVFGPGMPERRRRERAGTAYPLVDGHFVIGALVLIGPPIERDGPVAEQIGRLVVELGPRLAAARAVSEAEQRAVQDPLTGLPNRREFEQLLGAYVPADGTPPPPATLVYADLDRFKVLNDTLGHAAGDSALRHVADVLREQIRDRDLVARIGGEEFAVWLPETPLGQGMEVAERIRAAVEASIWRWSGTRYPLTTSCGVANYPVTVGDVNNLRAAADAALYKAKEAGRNRVEKAGAAD